MFCFLGIFFQKKHLLWFLYVFKAINQNLRQHEQLIVASGFQLEILLM